MKLQSGRQNDLTESEQELVEKLLLNHEENKKKNSEREADQLEIQKRLEKRQKINNQDPKYRDCDFILGSNAIFERVFSMAKNVLSENRRRMTPELFEAILFLKLNENLWDINLVSRAIAQAKSSRTNKRINNHKLSEKILN